MGEWNCKVMMRDYLISKQPVFYYRTIICLLITLLVCNIIIYTYGLQIPVVSIYFAGFVVFFIFLWIINFIAAKCVSNEELDTLVRKCQLCMADPNIKNIADLTKEDFANYSGRI